MTLHAIPSIVWWVIGTGAPLSGSLVWFTRRHPRAEGQPNQLSRFFRWVYQLTTANVALFVSVRQNDPLTNPCAGILTPCQLAALSPEDQFLTSFCGSAQYGRIAASLVFDENLGEDVP